MGGAFSKKSKQPQSRVSEQDRAVLQLKQQRDKIKQYLKRLELGLEKDRELARKLLQEGRKERAKLLLRKKRFQEQCIERGHTQLENIDRLILDIETTQIEIEVVDSLKTGNDCLKSLNSLMSLEDVENILFETQESVEFQRQIDQLIASGGGLSKEDESDILAELERITAESEPIQPSLPEVPTEPLPEVSEPTPEKQRKVRESPKAGRKKEALLAS